MSRAISLIQQRRQPQSRRWQSANAAAAGSGDAKISGIVDQIGQLTLLETADLVSALKVRTDLQASRPALRARTDGQKSRLNIPDMPIGNFSAGPAAGAVGAAAPAEEDEPAPKAQEKSLFNLTLKSFDAAAKPKVIKEIKSLLNLSLVESKKFVESAPKQMSENVTKEDAEKIIETLKAVGAVVTME